MVSAYQTTWSNIGQAVNIIDNPKAAFGDRLFAATYVTAVVEAHVVAAVFLVVAGADLSGGNDAQIPDIRVPGKTIDPNTGESVQRFISQPDGTTLIEPEGGSTDGKPNGDFTQTRYPDGSYYQRYDDNGIEDPHGHGYNQNGDQIDNQGNPVDPNSPDAHWPVTRYYPDE